MTPCLKALKRAIISMSLLLLALELHLTRIHHHQEAGSRWSWRSFTKPLHHSPRWTKTFWLRSSQLIVEMEMEMGSSMEKMCICGPGQAIIRVHICLCKINTGWFYLSQNAHYKVDDFQDISKYYIDVFIVVHTITMSIIYYKKKLSSCVGVNISMLSPKYSKRGKR